MVSSGSFKQFLKEHFYLIDVHLKPEVECLIFLASGCRGQTGGRQGEMSVSVPSTNRLLLGNGLVFTLPIPVQAGKASYCFLILTKLHHSIY